VKIELVHLENIRSHVKTTVPFARGFNCLVGGVGSGKSSILYAVDFALFGEPIGRTFEYLLREEAKNGTITVEFTQNGKNYKISRGLKKRGKGINQDFDELKLYESGNIISSVKSEAVAEQIKALTGLDREIFREIVWVRQEHLKELLDARPRERQTRLDELFGLADYETAWSNLQSYQKEYEGERNAHEKDSDVTGLEKLSLDYNRAVEEFSVIELQLEESSKKLNTAKKTLEDADARLKELEEVKARNEEFRRKEAQTAANINNLQNTLASLEQKITTQKTTMETLKQRLQTMETQAATAKTELSLHGISPNQTVDEIKQFLSFFEDKITSLKAEQEAAMKNIQTDTRRISSISAENRCPLCLQTLTEDYKNAMVSRIQQENSERQRTISQLQQQIEEMQKTKTKANTALSNLQQYMPRIEDLKTRLKEESEALNSLAQEYEEKQKTEQELHMQLDLVRLEISRFDVSELETAKERRDQAFKQYYSIESELQTKENRKRDLERRLNETKERIDVAQQKIERISKLGRAVEFIIAMRDAYRSIQPKLRGEFVKVLRNFVQQVLDTLTGGEGAFLNVLIDDTYTPFVKSESGVEREVSYLSGGERTLLAFAYRLGLGQLIMQSRTGHGLSLLLLDEPTESLGREDGSIDRLAEAISRFKAIEQIIAVTHSEAFAEKAEHVIRLEKEAGTSKVSVER
jgi:exonuclease SbcC